MKKLLAAFAALHRFLLLPGRLHRHKYYDSGRYPTVRFDPALVSLFKIYMQVTTQKILCVMLREHLNNHYKSARFRPGYID